VYNNFLLTFDWYAGGAIELLICILLVRKHLSGQWPSLLTYCAASLFLDLILFIERANYSSYAHIVWFWIGMAALLRLWVLVDVVRSFRGAGFIGYRIRLAIFAVAFILAAGSWALASLEHDPKTRELFAAAVFIDRSVAFAWSAFLVTIVAAIRAYGLAWTRTAIRVTWGLGIKIGTATLTSVLVSVATRPVRHAALNASSVISVAAIAIWLNAMWRDRPHADMLPHAGSPEKAGNP
jgi:hypothetical protein